MLSTRLSKFIIVLRNDMKWFHHECAARHDPKLQMLGASHGAEGIGIYWGLLEEIGQHSDTFHLKIIGISPDIDKNFSNKMSDPKFLSGVPQSIPRLPLKILSKNLFTSPKKLINVIELCVEIGLFDANKWSNYNLLYSPSFEHRADDYTRRVRRINSIHTDEGKNKVCTHSEYNSNNQCISSEETTDTVRTKFDKVLIETETDKKNRIRTEKNMQVTNSSHVDNSAVSSNSFEIDSSEEKSSKINSLYLIEPNDEVFEKYILRFHSIIQKWNKDNPAHTLEWQPSITELKKLFYAGEYKHKLSMCFHAYKLLGEKINYPELVIRALRLMLETNTKAKIENPFGWMWSCLHGNGKGTKPWVQFMTAEEEHVVSDNYRQS